MTGRPPVVVSACLLGRCCRYDGGHKESAAVRAAVAGRSVVAVCPEELGDLGTPRPAAELRGGDGIAVLDGRARVVAEGDRDLTPAFIAGARAALAAARAAGAREVILKDRSPSCGLRTVHRDGEVVPGQGVFTALLLNAGEFAVTCETELDRGGAGREADARTRKSAPKA